MLNEVLSRCAGLKNQIIEPPYTLSNNLIGYTVKSLNLNEDDQRNDYPGISGIHFNKGNYFVSKQINPSSENPS